MFRLSVADIELPSYFVATAAVALGFFEREGLETELVLSTKEGPQRLRDGALDFFAGPAYAATQAFPEWKGAKLLCALAQYSYWFLAVRADLDVKRGDVTAVKGLRISCSPTLPGVGLRHLLAQPGVDLAGHVEIVPNPVGEKSQMGRSGLDAIEQGVADAFWGNGMRVAIAERAGVAKRHLDLRRGDGPPGARFYNFAALTTTDRLVREHPDAALRAIRAITKAQKALKADPSIATQVGQRFFSPEAAALIGGLIAQDAAFYDAGISAEAIDGLNKFMMANGLVREPVHDHAMVADRFRDAWKE